MVRIVYNKILAAWYVVSGPHQTPLAGRFESRAAAAAWRKEMERVREERVKRANLTPDEAKELAGRAVQFKRERGRVPALDSQDAWERRMAEGAAAFMRYRKEGRYEGAKQGAVT